MIDIASFSPVRSYELTCLVEPALTETEVTRIKDSIEKLVKKHSGSIVSQDDWGRKPLAYKIKALKKNFSEAHYLFWVVEFEADHAQAFEKDIYLTSEVIRHLFVVIESNSEEK